jgi:hypothetical protein
VLAPWTFKRAPVVIGRVRLDADKPHIGVAEFAARMRNYPPARKSLKRSHDSPHGKTFIRFFIIFIPAGQQKKYNARESFRLSDSRPCCAAARLFTINA